MLFEVARLEGLTKLHMVWFAPCVERTAPLSGVVIIGRSVTATLNVRKAIGATIKRAAYQRMKTRDW